MVLLRTSCVAGLLTAFSLSSGCKYLEDLESQLRREQAGEGNFVIHFAASGSGPIHSALLSLEEAELIGEDGERLQLFLSPVVLRPLSANGGMSFAFKGVPRAIYSRLRLVFSPISASRICGNLHTNIPLAHERVERTVTIQSAPEVGPTERAEILITLEMEQSFTVTDDPTAQFGVREVAFHPVLRAINEKKSGSVSGLVMTESRSNGTPEYLKGARVTVKQNDRTFTRTTTGPTGFYRLTGIPVGNYEIEIATAGYGTIQRPLRILRNAVTLADASLTLSQ